MKYRQRPAQCALAVSMAVSAGNGCTSSSSARPSSPDSPTDAGAPKVPSYDDAGVALEANVEEILAQLTQDEKLSMMAGAGKLQKGLWLSPGVPRLGLGGFAMSDGARGVGATQSITDRPQKATAFPVGSARGATFDAALEERVGLAIGGEARAWGRT